MLTSYDGTPVLKVNQSRLVKLAKMLMDIHKSPLDSLNGSRSLSYDFVSYFYPRIDEFPDIQHPLMELVQRANMKQECIIHGDYHLGNILEHEDELTVIDWTNVQMGDPRYDIAWSIILMWIYVSEKQASFTESPFVTRTVTKPLSLSCLKPLRVCAGFCLAEWTTPIRKDTIARVRSILMSNTYLNIRFL